MSNNQSLPKELKSEALIRFEDCDPFGHLNNGRFIDYFINAREDQVRENYELNIYDYLKSTGHGWVVASNQLAYLEPARLMEKVFIKTRLLWYNESELMVEGEMTDANEEKLKAIFWTKLVHIQIKTGARQAHPENLSALFGAVALHGQTKLSSFFEQRVKEIRSIYKAGIVSEA